MSASTTAASVGVGFLLLAWLASAVGVSRAPQPPPRSGPPSESRQLEALRADVQEQASRLRTRLAAAPAPRPAERNPFAFGSRAREHTRVKPAAAPARDVAPAPDAEPAEPILVLIGIAERQTAEGLLRTAILADVADQLHLVTTGEVLARDYRVRGISPDSVELERMATGEIRRLHLK